MEKGKFAFTKFASRIVVLVVAVAALAVPACALKVYINPSIQTGNYSPDGVYNECTGMQDVAARLFDKCVARGFEARNSAMLSLAGASADSNSWGSDCFVALHSNATGSSSWDTAHGTMGIYHAAPDGTHNSNCSLFASLLTGKVVEKFTALGLGQNNGIVGDYPYEGFYLAVLNPTNTSAIPAALVEGLYHSNYNDVYANGLYTTTGLDAYAQGVFEGICDYYGLSYTLNTDGPDSDSWDANRIDIISRGSNNHIMQKVWAGGLTGPYDLGGSTTAAPAVCSWASGRLDVFCNTSNALYHRYYNGNWSTSWENMGGSMQGGPAAVSWGANHIDVFIRDNVNRIVNKFWNGSTWSGWVYLNGSPVGDPCACSYASGRLDVFYRGTNNHLYQQYYTGGAWSGSWLDKGGSLTSDPSAVSWGNRRIDIVARGASNHIYHIYWDNGAWGAWEDLGGSAASAPSISSRGYRLLDVYYRGTDNHLRHKYFDDAINGWSDTWEDWGSY